jgi:3-phenylpropionate/trans-cinnamate dioxygenase ferredoxin subunit
MTEGGGGGAMTGWHRACKDRELKEGEPVSVKIDGTPLGLYRVGDNCYAVHDVGTHEFALLSNGYQDGEVIECPLHAARFSVVTGKCLAVPAETDLATYDVKVEDGEILVKLSG